jgi:hypothetical protein
LISRAAVSLILGSWVVAVAAMPAHADRSAPETGRITGPIRVQYVGGARPSGSALCQMGEPDTSFDIVNYISPPNDSYYTLLESSQCPACVAPDTLLIKFAHVVLSYSVQCLVQAEVRIVAATGGPGCWEPDTGVVLCPTRAVNLEPTSSGTFDLVMNLSSGCRIAQDAFLCITFMSFAAECDPQPWHPNLVLSSQCAPCESYNEYDSFQGRTRKDICGDLGFFGKPTMYVDGELCTTPAVPTSWGTLKIRYR